MHLLQPVGDLLEALAQALLERRVQLLVHRGAHLLELLLVVGLDRGQPRLDGTAHLAHALVVGQGQRGEAFAERLGEAAERVGLLQRDAAERGVLRLTRRQRLRAERKRGLLQGVAEQLLGRGELGAKAVDLLVLRARHVALLVQQRLLEGGERLRQLLARAGRAARHFVAQSALERLRVGAQRGLQFSVQRTLRCVVGAAQRQPEGEKKNEDEKGERQPVEQRHGSIVAAGPLRRALRPSHRSRRTLQLDRVALGIVEIDRRPAALGAVA